eukprot:2371459-Pleurochrysis_carterae.AAC.1
MRSSCIYSRSSWRGFARRKRLAVWGMPCAVAIATASTSHASYGVATWYRACLLCANRHASQPKRGCRNAAI